LAWFIYSTAWLFQAVKADAIAIEGRKH
jgi:hypothetical protein